MSYKKLLSLPAFHAVIWVGTSLSIVSYGLRAYIRIRLFRRLLLDDWLMLFALLMLTATAAIQQPTMKLVYELLQVLNEAREPSPTFRRDAKIAARAYGVTYLFYTLGVYAVKLSFLVFFYRLGSRITFYLVLWWGVVLITVGFGAATVGIVNYSCEFGPIDDMMRHCTMPDSLVATFDMFKLSVAMDLVTDALIILFPMLILWRVRVSVRKKAILAGVFGLVAFTIVVTSFRNNIFNSEIRDMRNGDIRAINLAWSWFWHHVQLSVSIIIACLVSFRALFCQPSGSTSEKKAAREYYQRRRQQAQKNRASNTVDVRGRVAGRFRQFHDTVLETFRDLEDIDVMDDRVVPLPPAGESDNGSRQEIWTDGEELSRLEEGGGESSITGRSSRETSIKRGQNGDQQSVSISPLEPVHHGIGWAR
ncbi:hypothetical protein QBC42DRAFT_276964 [Cladorrhinum samala]|uniref:Rhodopsin domain-containing protein n=1 Tax=Cladorrhinum samala TaxID=585594 RepID=A0AAV9HCE4_9PEZI|nr:hypothetical protein QBC42DRAFT_276964 [Cladorrhinum samala]